MVKVEGFERAGIEASPFSVMSLLGRPGKGKSHFSLTAPGPIAVQNIDIGLKDVLEKFSGEKVIIVKRYAIAINLKSISKTISRKQAEAETRSPLEIDIDAVIKEWEAFKKDYIALLQNPDIRTIVWDTGTEVWQLIRAARFGKLDMVEGHLYGPVNMEMNYLVKLAFEFKKNLIVLHKMKDEYNEQITSSGKKVSYATGKDIMDGFKNMPHLAEICGEMSYDKEEKQFSITITRCRPNPDLIGETYSGDMCNFPFIASMAYPNVDPDVWEGEAA